MEMKTVFLSRTISKLFSIMFNTTIWVACKIVYITMTELSIRNCLHRLWSTSCCLLHSDTWWCSIHQRTIAAEFLALFAQRRANRVLAAFHNKKNFFWTTIATRILMSNRVRSALIYAEQKSSAMVNQKKWNHGSRNIFCQLSLGFIHYILCRFNLILLCASSIRSSIFSSLT